MRDRMNKARNEMQIVVLNSQMDDMKSVVQEAAVNAGHLTREAEACIPPSFKDRLEAFMAKNGCEVTSCRACSHDQGEGCTHPSNPGNLI